MQLRRDKEKAISHKVAKYVGAVDNKISQAAHLETVTHALITQEASVKDRVPQVANGLFAQWDGDQAAGRQEMLTMGCAVTAANATADSETYPSLCAEVHHCVQRIRADMSAGSDYQIDKRALVEELFPIFFHHESDLGDVAILHMQLMWYLQAVAADDCWGGDLTRIDVLLERSVNTTTGVTLKNQSGGIFA